MVNKDGTYDYAEYMEDVQEMSPHDLMMKYANLSLIRLEHGQAKLRELEESIERAVKNDFELGGALLKLWLDEIKEIRKLL